MDPAKPPLPCPRYLPFQPVSGSHTSILMSESLAGLMVAVTRQNAGRFLVDGAGTPEPDGGTNAPASTGCADVMVVSGSFNAARLSQVAAIAGTPKHSISRLRHNLRFTEALPELIFALFALLALLQMRPKQYSVP